MLLDYTESVWDYPGPPPTTVYALQLWDILNRLGQLAPPTSPLALQTSPRAPLGGFPWYTPGEHLSFFRLWAVDGEVCCGRSVQDQGLLSLEFLRDQYGRLPLDKWRYNKLQHFICSLPQAIRSPFSATPFEKLCMSTDLIPHSISVLYCCKHWSPEESQCI